MKISVDPTQWSRPGWRFHHETPQVKHGSAIDHRLELPGSVVHHLRPLGERPASYRIAARHLERTDEAH